MKRITLNAGSLTRMVRLRRPRQIPNRIAVKWAITREDGEDLYVAWGAGCPSPDARLALSQIAKLSEELERRGYDITTIRFEVKRANK